MMRAAMIRHGYMAYQEARRILASNHTTVAERKAAIDIKDDFLASAPAFVGELLQGMKELRDYTDGEECADPDSCNTARGNPVWLCSRCRIRETIPDTD